MSCYNSRCQEKSQGNPAKMLMSSKFKLQQYGNDQVEILWEMDSSVLPLPFLCPLFQPLSHLLPPPQNLKKAPRCFIYGGGFLPQNLLVGTV